MTDTNLVYDDSPLTTSKDEVVADLAVIQAGGSKGDSVSARTTTINRPRAELFAYWRDFANLASFMENIERIEVLDNRRSHWVVNAPGGRTVEWDALVTAEKEGRMIAWQSAEDAGVSNSGRVDFADATGGRGTAVTVTISYDPPGGSIGKIIATILQREPGLQARRDLRRFKQLMETGEIAVSARTKAQAKAEKE